MAMNRKMHPRNIYKNPPDFKKLAIDYEEFRQHAKMDLSGKVVLDFKDPAALRALTRTLLINDWKLDVVILPDKLVPTLPLRLNYILWLEDLLSFIGRETPITGIDIGTGASCIYPLLAARKNGWHMVGTEQNADCVTCAQDNIQRNGLQSLVSVVKVTGESVLLEPLNSLSNKTVYDFCMCNPPFFSSDEELEPEKGRSSNRPPPNNARTGSSHETVVRGGEVAFVQKMIDESVLLKDRIRIMSSMLGRKTSVDLIIRALKNVGVSNVVRMEFCQGRVTRWGVAWSYSVDLSQFENPIKTQKKEKPRGPLRMSVSCGENGKPHELKEVLTGVKNLLDRLLMQYKVLENTSTLTIYEVTASSNTWSNQRRKRREQLRKTSESCERDPPSQPEDKCHSSSISSHRNVNSDKMLCTSDGLKRPSNDTGDEIESKRLKLSSPQSSAPQSSDTCFLKMCLAVRLQTTEQQIEHVIEMNWLEGVGGRDAVHQIMQYFKNNLMK